MNEYDIEKRMEERRIKRAKALHKKQMLIQKLIGVGMLLLSVAIILIASKGLTPEDKDATAILITIPMGIYLIFTKELVVML